MRRGEREEGQTQKHDRTAPSEERSPVEWKRIFRAILEISEGGGVTLKDMLEK